MARVVVLGGSGFIGSNMVAFLKKKGHFVRAADIQLPEFRGELWSQADQWIKYDLRKQIGKELVGGVDWVFNFAASMGGVGFFHTDKDQPAARDNAQINLNVLKACEEQDVKRLFFSSSVCSYPDTGRPLKESEWGGGPADQLYGEEKRFTTMLLDKSPIARVAHFDTVFGPFQEFEGERMKFPPAITRKVIEAKRLEESIDSDYSSFKVRTRPEVEIWGDGEQVRNLLYIDDLVEMVYEIMSTDSYEGPVNIASKTPVTIQEVADALCKEAGIAPHYVYRTDKPVGVKERRTDTSEWDRRYTYRPKTPTIQGFQRLYSWMETQLHDKNRHPR